MKQGRARGWHAAMCWRARSPKIRYRTLKDAKVARSQRMQRGEEYLRIYKCPECRGHHLTSQPARTAGSTVWTEPQRGFAAVA